ncbi:MAG: (2Fe-2S)-binding protein [Sarcina sp.]
MENCKNDCEDRIICTCKQVKLSIIKDAIASGCTTVDEVSQKTTAGTGCGKCKGLIQEIIDGKDPAGGDKVIDGTKK